MKLIDRLAVAVSPRNPSRRSFLAKAAVVGSALAVNPWGFIFKPGTAYASVCGDGVGCSTGWTAFCCTISNGANTCPPNTYPGGWWKADNSAFCSGGPRYYVDCNMLPGRSCTCGCAKGTCDERKTCCNVFRYGQCHTEVKQVTPIMCRVILCMPPWQWDPACGSTPLTDNRTINHSAPCLPGLWPSAIAVKYQDMGMTGSPLGAPITSEGDSVGNGRHVFYQNGAIFWKSEYGARAVYSEAYKRWNELNREWGALGYPTTDFAHTGTAGGKYIFFEKGAVFSRPDLGTFAVYGDVFKRWTELGREWGALGFPTSSQGPASYEGQYQFFEKGAVFFRVDTGLHEVTGDIYGAWSRLNREWGKLGYPTSKRKDVGDDRGTVQSFEHGEVWATATTGAHGVHGPTYERYIAIGGPDGDSGLGYPTYDPGKASADGEYAFFEGGAIFRHPTIGAFEVVGKKYATWSKVNREWGVLGYPVAGPEPVGDRRGSVQRFQTGKIWESSSTGAHEVHGSILETYEDEGGPTGDYGYPTTDVYKGGDGRDRCDFEGGTIRA